jgi:hypothetical protein
MCLLTVPLYPALHNEEPDVCFSSLPPCYMHHHFSGTVIESQRRANYFLEVQRTMLLVLYHVTKLSTMIKSPGFLCKIWLFMHNLCLQLCSYKFLAPPLTLCPIRITELFICKSCCVSALCLLCTHVDNLCFQTCSKCQMRRKCTKSFTIQKFPKILVLRILCYLDFYLWHEWTAVAVCCVFNRLVWNT